MHRDYNVPEWWRALRHGLESAVEGTFDGQLAVPGDAIDELEWYPDSFDESAIDQLYGCLMDYRDCAGAGGDHREMFLSDLRGMLSNKYVPRKTRLPRCRRPKATWITLHPVRICSHCSATKTPQWRTGPEGRGTLCNACGLRYKSGRLYEII